MNPDKKVNIGDLVEYLFFRYIYLGIVFAPCGLVVSATNVFFFQSGKLPGWIIVIMLIYMVPAWFIAGKAAKIYVLADYSKKKFWRSIKDASIELYYQTKLQLHLLVPSRKNKDDM